VTVKARNLAGTEATPPQFHIIVGQAPPYLPLVIWPKKCAITELRKLACIGKENQSSANTMKNCIKLLNDLKEYMKSSLRKLNCFILKDKVWFLKILLKIYKS
jgi:hypothetical protein